MGEKGGRLRKAKANAKLAGLYVAAPFVVAPTLTNPLLTNPKVGEAAVKGVKRLAARGDSGTGTPIRNLHGHVKELATLARLGLGPKANGGYGVDGGQLVLRIVEGTVIVASMGVAVGAHVVAEKRRMAKAAAHAAEVARVCESCGASLVERGENLVCPICQPSGSGQA